MALNYSYQPVFPPHISEDNFVSPLRIVNGCFVEGVPEKNGEGCSRPWHVNQGEPEEWNFKRGKDAVHPCSSSELDVVDRLPPDPFGMDIETTFTAITGWLEDLEVDYGWYATSRNLRASQEGNDLFAGWYLIWNNALKFLPYPSNVQFVEKLNLGIQSFQSNFEVHEGLFMDTQSFPNAFQFDEKLNEVSTENHYRENIGTGGAMAPRNFIYQRACIIGGTVGSGDWNTSCSSELQLGEKVEDAAIVEGMPHQALDFALGYLEVKDLLAVERVCKSLCSTIRDDPLFWMDIHIDQPLNEWVTDDVLANLARRAQGNLQSLSLVECPRVTNDGLRRILETNPRLTKLCVPGCTRLRIEGILDSIKMHNSSKDFQGIKYLRIGGIYGVTHEHFEELKLLLGANSHKHETSPNKHFYHRGNLYLPHDDDRAIDIEMCPRCDKLRLVYDCPAEGCQVKKEADKVCRACTLCIARCAQCGRCISDTEYEETFCLQLLCSDCYKRPLHYQERLDRIGDSSGTLSEPSDHFNLSG